MSSIGLLETEPKQGTSIGQDCWKDPLSIASKEGRARPTCPAAAGPLLSIYDKSEQDTLTN
ncbi:MAG: hypothetical protein IPN62_04495 [Flavobacteriales bacterium]|nr:hypothetical protein [Flavobacteriales bacterium]